MANGVRYPHAVLTKRIDATTQEWVHEKGVLRMVRPQRGLVCTRIVGFAPVEFLVPIMAAVDADVLLGLKPDVFHDWDEMSGYAPEARGTMTKWYLSIRDACSSVNVYTQSKLVAMGVSVVAIATGNRIMAHTSRDAFDQALRRATSVRRANER